MGPVQIFEDGGREKLRPFRCSGEIARHFFLVYPKKSYVRSAILYRGNDLLIFQDAQYGSS